MHNAWKPDEYAQNNIYAQILAGAFLHEDRYGG
jgi:hypothetical protein